MPAVAELSLWAAQEIHRAGPDTGTHMKAGLIQNRFAPHFAALRAAIKLRDDAIAHANREIAGFRDKIAEAATHLDHEEYEAARRTLTNDTHDTA